MKRIQAAVCFLLALVCVMTACSARAPAASQTGEVLADQPFYKIIQESASTYRYYLYDQNKKPVFDALLPRKPEIDMAGEKLVRISVAAGDSPSSVTTCYYDAAADVFSQKFIAVLDDNGTRLVQSESNRLVIRDIFDRSKFYQTVSEFSPPLSPKKQPILSAELSEDGKSLRVTCLSGDPVRETVQNFQLD